MITNILINSSTAKIYNNGTQNLSFNIDVPPIDISNNAILKVANFCHMGTATNHADNIYLFKIRGVNVNNSKYIDNVGGNPIILATTFNNNRSLYEENEITLARQTINNIDIVCDTNIPYGYITSVSINSGGSGYVKNQIISPTFTGSNSNVSNVLIKISSVNSGVIDGLEIINGGTEFQSNATTLPTTSLNGSGAILTATQSAGAINSIGITNAGTGYKVGQTLAFTGGGGANANISIATTGTEGNILTFTITSGGTGYTSNPTAVSINPITNNTTATITPFLRFGYITNGIPNTLNFCMSLRIEDEKDDD